MNKIKYPIGISSHTDSTLDQFIQKENLELLLSNHGDLKQFLNYFIKEYFKNNDKIRIVVSNKIAEIVSDNLNDLGYSNSYINSNSNKDELSNKIQVLHELKSKKWEDTLNSVKSQFNNVMIPLDLHFKALETEVIKPFNFQLLAQSYINRILNQKSYLALDINLETSDFKVNKDEFLHLRSRIELIAKLYNEEYFKNKLLDQYSDVLFDMLTEKETYHLINDQISSGILHLTNYKNALEKAYLVYKRDLFHFYHNQLSQLINLYQDIEVECRPYFTTYNDGINSSQSTNIISKWLATNQTGPIKKQLIQRYRLFKSEWDNTIFSKSLSFPVINDWNDLITTIESSNIESNNWGEIIQLQISSQFSRITYNNVQNSLISKNKINQIKDDIRTTLDEVNNNKIFNYEIEDNTLYIKNTIQFLTQTINNWKDVVKNLDSMTSYHPWRKLWDTESTHVKKLCTLLFDMPKKDWIKQFENWYFRLMIVKNMNPFLIDDHQKIKDANAIANRLSNLQKTILQNDLSVKCKKDILELQQSIAPLRKWKMGTQVLPPIEEEVKQQLINTFPIIISTDKELGINDYNNSISIQEIDGQYNIQFLRASQTEIDLKKEYIKFRPVVDKSIVQSTHSQRWEQIKEIAKYLMNLKIDLTLYENKDFLILSFFNNHPISEQLIQEYGHSIKKLSSSDENFSNNLTESLLDNNRNMSFITLDGSLFPIKDSTDYIWHHEMIEFLKFIGLHEQCTWTKLIDLWSLESSADIADNSDIMPPTDSSNKSQNLKNTIDF